MWYMACSAFVTAIDSWTRIHSTVSPHRRLDIRITLAALLVSAACSTRSTSQTVQASPAAESVLRQYTGVYRRSSGEFLYLQLWSELTGGTQLVAFDDSGSVRVLFPLAGRDQFFAGRAAAIPSDTEATIT